MNAVAVIPARGGSKGLPRKNVRLLCGKPLIAWTIEAARRAETIGRVIVSTDDAEIASISANYGAEVVRRPPDLSGDGSPSEGTLLHTLRHIGMDNGILVFLQCTSPLTLPEDIDGTVRSLRSGADSAFTAAPRHRFTWQRTPDGAVPVGHQKSYRPMRQEMKDQFEEVGAVYAMRVAGFMQAQHRFPGKTVIYEIPGERSFEIDEETDFVIVEALMRRRLAQDKAACLPAQVDALVMDFDGVLTDNRVHVSEAGVESVVCHRGDGWAIGRMRASGMRLLVLTNETNPAVRRRCEKLGVECMVTQDKLPAMQAWLRRHGIPRETTCYIGNDEPDVPCMQFVGCAVVPADAHASALAAAHIVLATPGGRGCIRELADLLLSEGSGLPCHRRRDTQ